MASAPPNSPGPLAAPDIHGRDGVAENGKTRLGVEAAVGQLTRESAGWDGGNGQAVTLTYAFRAEAGRMPQDTAGFSRFSAEQIATTEQVLSAWADVANITFQRVGSGAAGEGAYSNAATMLFANYTSGFGDFAAFGYYPGSRASGANPGDVWVNSTVEGSFDFSRLGDGAHLLAHEIGHALGLAHPSSYSDDVVGNSAGYMAEAAYFEDSRQYTVMSYFGGVNSGAALPGFAGAPQMDDIAAVQRFYGANMTTRTGDTVYGFHSNADRDWLRIDVAETKILAAIWDAGGTDTLDFSGYGDNQSIDLRQGYFSDVGGNLKNISIAVGADIENAMGGAGADTITGNALGNVLSGGEGGGTIMGGAGDDTISQASGQSYLRGDEGADLITGGVDFDDLNGNQGADTVSGGAGDDWVLGGKDNDLLSGDAGADLVFGNIGADTLHGGDGNDVIRGGQHDDLLFGGAGDDFLAGDRGSDTITGGAGADTFHSFAEAGLDRVLDFNRSEGDRVLLAPGAVWRVSQAGADTVIDLDGGGRLVLANVQASSLSGDWIAAG